MRKTLKGGSFNLENSRDHDTVKREVTTLLSKHDLDFLCVQEATRYGDILNDIPGYTYFDGEAGVLVKNTHHTDRVRSDAYGDGWITVKKKFRPAQKQVQVRVAKWLYVRSIHLPTPSFWKNGKIDDSRTPPNRKDDLIANMKGLRRYFSWPCIGNARLAAGDWNEAPDTYGQYSPGWLKSKTQAHTAVPASMKGHGHIDWTMFKGCVVTGIFKDLEIREGSDHEPVVFAVTKN